MSVQNRANKNEIYLWCEDESVISPGISPTSQHFVGGIYLLVINVVMLFVTL